MVHLGRLNDSLESRRTPLAKALDESRATELERLQRYENRLNEARQRFANLVSLSTAIVAVRAY